MKFAIQDKSNPLGDGVECIFSSGVNPKKTNTLISTNELLFLITNLEKTFIEEIVCPTGKVQICPDFSRGITVVHVGCEKYDVSPDQKTLEDYTGSLLEMVNYQYKNEHIARLSSCHLQFLIENYRRDVINGVNQALVARCHDFASTLMYTFLHGSAVKSEDSYYLKGYSDDGMVGDMIRIYPSTVEIDPYILGLTYEIDRIIHQWKEFPCAELKVEIDVNSVRVVFRRSEESGHSLLHYNLWGCKYMNINCPRGDAVPAEKCTLKMFLDEVDSIFKKLYSPVPA